jgi:serine/threonine protein kinase
MQVYLARWQKHTLVAIKTVLDGNGEEEDMLLKEAEMLQQLRHPNIVQFLGVCRVPGKVTPPTLTPPLSPVMADWAIAWDFQRRVSFLGDWFWCVFTFGVWVGGGGGVWRARRVCGAVLTGS